MATSVDCPFGQAAEGASMTKRRQSPRWWAVATLVVAASCVAPSARSQDLPSPREQDVWGRFGAGSWKQVHIVTETLDEKGNSTSKAETEVRTTLWRVGRRGATLRFSVAVEAGGRRFDTEPQTVQHGYYGEDPDQKVQVKDLGSTTVKVDGREYPCRVEQTSFDMGSQKVVTKLIESDAQAPFLLRRETQVTDPANPAASREETAVVVALDVPYNIGKELKTVSYERSTQKTSQGQTVTLDVVSVDVPGGIVNRTVKEYDSDGHLVRRQTVELVDFKAVDDGGGRAFRRRRRRVISESSSSDSPDSVSSIGSLLLASRRE